MLTNNKKRSFVKLIALTLAALMVFSVCLTGCTDEDARTAAQNAQNAADAAQSAANAAQSAADAKTTAEAVAAQITEALKPYLKADAAMTEADVKSAIENALTGYQAKGDYATKTDLTNALKDYMKSSDALTKKAVEDMLKSYQAKGDYATKSDLTAALKDYAKSDDVTVAVANYITKTEMAAALESFAAFAKSEDLSALSDALTDAMDAALTAEDVADLITEALVDYATTAYVDEAIAAAKEAEREITTAEIAEAIKKALADYDVTIKEYIDKADADLKALIESYFGTFTPEQVVALLKNVDKSMDAEQWAAATVQVTRVLKKAATLMDKVVGKSYTQARKAEINGYLAKINGLDTHVVVFETKTATYKDSNGATQTIGTYLDDAHNTNLLQGEADIDVRVATARIMTDLTVFILRAATVDELVAIETAVDKAIAVPTFENDINAWVSNLYTIGKTAAVQKMKADGSGYEDDKWEYGSDMKYHNTTVKNGVKYVQVATYADEAKYNTAKANLENMIVTYLLEAMLFGQSAESDELGSYKTNMVALWKYSKDNTVYYSWEIPGSYANEKLVHADGSEFNVTAMAQIVDGKGDTAPSAMKTADTEAEYWSFVGYFAGIDNSALPSGTFKNTDKFEAVKAANWVATTVDTSANNNWGSVVAGYFDAKLLDLKDNLILGNGPLHDILSHSLQ